MSVTIAYDNDTGPDDDGFWEWWSLIESDDLLCKAFSEASAQRIATALNCHDDLLAACKELLSRYEGLCRSEFEGTPFYAQHLQDMEKYHAMIAKAEATP